MPASNINLTSETEKAIWKFLHLQTNEEKQDMKKLQLIIGMLLISAMFLSACATGIRTDSSSTSSCSYESGTDAQGGDGLAW